MGDTSTGQQAHWFVTTRWSAVVAAVGSDSTYARNALNELCQAYWYPLYAYIRRLGHRPHDAEDIIQSFFARCLEKKYFANADQAKGRFRSFLLLALKRFMANEWKRTQTQKRGAGKSVVSLDALTAEQRYALEPADRLTAEKLYDRRWALTLLEGALERLRREHHAAGRIHVFDSLKEFLTDGGRGTPHVEVAARLGIEPGAVKVAIHRLRSRYREILEQEIAKTVSSPGEALDERRYLLTVLADS